MNTKTYQYRFMKNESINNNIFKIGANCYFENPTTDLLSFYITPNNEHPFNDIILKALLNTLDLDINTKELLSITREHLTADNKRIDLIIEFENNVIAIETKVTSNIKTNPFDSYDEYINTKYHNKNKHRFVLTPKEKYKQTYWDNINYKELLKNIDNLVDFEELLMNHPNNKWIIFFKEYLINLHDITKVFIKTKVRTNSQKLNSKRAKKTIKSILENTNTKSNTIENYNRIKKVIDRNNPKYSLTLFDNLKDTTPKYLFNLPDTTLTINSIYSLLKNSSNRVIKDKHDNQLFNTTIYNGTRNKNNAMVSNTINLDFDNGNLAPEKAHDIFSKQMPYTNIVYNTSSRSEEKPNNFRMLLFADRYFNQEEHSIIIKYLIRILEENGYHTIKSTDKEKQIQKLNKKYGEGNWLNSGLDYGILKMESMFYLPATTKGLEDYHLFLAFGITEKTKKLLNVDDIIKCKNKL